MATSTTRTDSAQESGKETETETGLDENVATALSYVLGFLSGIVMLLVEGDNDRVRFHAAQSIVVFGGIFVATIALNFFQIAVGSAPIVGVVVGAILGLVSLVLWVGAMVIWLYLVVRAYQGEDPRIPGAAGIANNLL